MYLPQRPYVPARDCPTTALHYTNSSRRKHHEALLRRQSRRTNIVGYAGSALRETGNTLTSALFMDISSPTGAIKLSSIVPVKDNGEVAEWWEIGVQYLLYNGYTDNDHNYMWNGEGWEDTDFNPCDDVIIPAGQGLWVNNSTGGAVSFRSSGEVNQDDVIFELRDSGNTAAANCFPTATTLGEILPAIKNSDEVPEWWEVGIQFLLYNGYTDNDHNYMWNGEGWEDTDFNPCDDEPIPVGQGLWVNNSSGKAVTLRIPAPEL